MDGGRRVKLVAAVAVVAVLENRSAKGERSTQIKLLIQISRDEKVNLAIFPTMLPGKHPHSHPTPPPPPGWLVGVLFHVACCLPMLFDLNK